MVGRRGEWLTRYWHGDDRRERWTRPLEDVVHGLRLGLGEPMRAKALPPIVDDENIIKTQVDVDSGSGVTALSRSGRELEHVAKNADGVVVLDGPLVFEAADALEMAGGGAPGRLRLGRRMGEALIEARKKSHEDALRLGQRADLGEAELTDEAILQGAKEPLHAAFPLGRVSWDPLNAQLLKRPADLRDGFGAGQLVP